MVQCASRLTTTLGLVAAIFASVISASLASDDFAYLEGAWTPTTGPSTGAPFWFTKAFAGYDALIPWWGQTTIVLSDGKFGSHIKIVGTKQGANAECFYYINKLDKRRMAWALKHADNGDCPGSLVFEKRYDDDIGDESSKKQTERANLEQSLTSIVKVEGWWPLKAKSCTSLGKFDKSKPLQWALIPGDDDTRPVGKPATQYCILDTKYERTVVPGYRCGGEEMSLLFFKEPINPNERVLSPWLP